MNISIIDSDAIYSTFATDSWMSELVEMYVAEMPKRIAALEQAFVSGDRVNLKRAVHQMKGAAGSYGFDPLSHSAADLDSAIREGQSPETIRRKFDELIELCRRIRTSTASVIAHTAATA
jgi:HPt (histidine-containing phosphotransfer) domain-containing protein